MTSAGNLIRTGTLDVELYHSNNNDTDEKVTQNVQLFDGISSGLWEPGAVVYENFTVKNAGSLALKYQLGLKVDQESVVNGHRLSEAIHCAIVPEGVDASSRNAVIEAGASSTGGWRALSTQPMGQCTGELLAGTEDKWGIILYWLPTDQDNNFNMNNANNGTVLDMQVAVDLLATQMTHESDSFGNNYDATADFTQAVVTQVGSDGRFTVSSDNNTWIVSGEAVPGEAVSVIIEDAAPTQSIISAVQDGQTVASYDIEVSGQNTGSLVTVQLQLESNLTDVKAYHGDTLMTEGSSAANGFSYDAATGILTMYVDSFSPFHFIYTRPGYRPPASPVSDFTWARMSDGNGIEITKYNGNSARVEVPKTIDGLPVVRIGEKAFAGDTCLTHVILPDSVTSIGKQAFYQCSSLESMDSVS